VACTLLSDSHVELVVCVCNYLNKPHVLKATSFLGLAEQVEYVLGTNREPVNVCFADSDNVGMSVQLDESSVSKSSDLGLQVAHSSMSGLHTSTMSAMPAAKIARTAPSPSF